MWVGVLRAGSTLRDEEVAILADGARAHRKLVLLYFSSQCARPGTIVLGGVADRGGSHYVHSLCLFACVRHQYDRPRHEGGGGHGGRPPVTGGDGCNL